MPLSKRNAPRINPPFSNFRLVWNLFVERLRDFGDFGVGRLTVFLRGVSVVFVLDLATSRLEAWIHQAIPDTQDNIGLQIGCQFGQIVVLDMWKLI